MGAAARHRRAGQRPADPHACSPSEHRLRSARGEDGAGPCSVRDTSGNRCSAWGKSMHVPVLRSTGLAAGAVVLALAGTALPAPHPRLTGRPRRRAAQRAPQPVARTDARTGAGRSGAGAVAAAGTGLVPPDLALPDARPDHGRAGPGPPRRFGGHRGRGSRRAHGLRGRRVGDAARPVDVRRRARREGPRRTRAARAKAGTDRTPPYRAPSARTLLSDPASRVRMPITSIGLPARAGQAARHQPALRDGRSRRGAGRRHGRLAPGAVPARPARAVLHAG